MDNRWYQDSPAANRSGMTPLYQPPRQSPGMPPGAWIGIGAGAAVLLLLTAFLMSTLLGRGRPAAAPAGPAPPVASAQQPAAPPPPGATPAGPPLTQVPPVAPTGTASGGLQAVPAVPLAAANSPVPSITPTPLASPPPPPGTTSFASPAPAAGKSQEPDASGEPALKYAWQVGSAYHCQFTLDATAGDLRPTARGVVVYEPTNIDPKTLGGEKESGEASGTGFVVTPDGVLVTCAHCVRGTTEIVAHLGQQAYPAKVIAYDGAHDVALVKIQAGNLLYLPLFDSERVELAQDVRAFGFPLSDRLGETIKITRGSIAGIVQRSYGKLFQVDASVNPGNSGGPLVDTQGRVVGIINSGLAPDEAERVNFAVPSSHAAALLRSKGIQAATQADGANLDGPGLAKRVTPAVAFLKLKIGPGGFGTGQQRVVRFLGSYNLEMPGALGVVAGSGALAKQESGKILVDSFGEIDAYEGTLHLPMLPHFLGRVGIEPLSDRGAQEWVSIRMLSLLRTEQVSTPGSYPDFNIRPPRYGPPRYGPPRYPFDRPPMPSMPMPLPGPAEPQVKVTVVPALEAVRYQLGVESADGTVTIRKEYELATLEEKDKPKFLEMKGNGTVVWDKKLGMPKRSDFSATLGRSGQGDTVQTSITLTCLFEQKAVGQIAYAPRPATGVASAAPTTSAPVRKVESPPGNAGAAAPNAGSAQAPPPGRFGSAGPNEEGSPVRKVQSAPGTAAAAGRASRAGRTSHSAGLDKFRPDE